MCGQYLTAAKYYLEYVRKKLNFKICTKCIKKEYGLIQKVDMTLAEKICHLHKRLWAKSYSKDIPKCMDMQFKILDLRMTFHYRYRRNIPNY
jgi:hypothetical protein